jgi:hypothetical protein
MRPLWGGVALIILGCGDAREPRDRFLGTWSGTLTSDGLCQDGSTIPLSTFAFQAVVTKGGTGSDLLQTSQIGLTCAIPLNLDNDIRASWTSGGDCTTHDGHALGLKMWALNIFDDVKRAVGSGDGTIDAPAAGGSCIIGFTGALTR